MLGVTYYQISPAPLVYLKLDFKNLFCSFNASSKQFDSKATLRKRYGALTQGPKNEHIRTLLANRAPLALQHTKHTLYSHPTRFAPPPPCVLLTTC